MGGFIKAALDPAGIFDGLADPGSPQPYAPTTQPSQLALDAASAGMNPEKGFIGGMTGPDTGLHLPNASDYLPQEPEPGVAPFQAQWSYSAGKGPQWLEPVDLGTSPKTTRQGDIVRQGTVDNGWSSQINNGPAKGNRF